MAVLQVFERRLRSECCNDTSQAVSQFVVDLEWLAGQGVRVERLVWPQPPDAADRNEVASKKLLEEGEKCLPLILLDGEVVVSGRYPSRDELVILTGLADQGRMGLFTPAVEQLIAIGAAIAANFESGFKQHYEEARKLGVSPEDVAMAVATARAVRDTATQNVLKLAGRHIAADREAAQKKPDGCCCGPNG